MFCALQFPYRVRIRTQIMGTGKSCLWGLRAVARSENPEGLVVLGGENVSPLVEIGLTDLPKTGGGLKPPKPPPGDGPAPLGKM